jgi:hypothetical protein
MVDRNTRGNALLKCVVDRNTRGNALLKCVVDRNYAQDCSIVKCCWSAEYTHFDISKNVQAAELQAYWYLLLSISKG